MVHYALVTFFAKRGRATLIKIVTKKTGLTTGKNMIYKFKFGAVQGYKSPLSATDR
jgi:hypothetical protein